MRDLKKIISSLILALIIGFVLIGTACNQTATDDEIKTKVSENGEPRLVVQLGHSGGISSAVYSPDGKFIVSGGIDDKVAILWEASTGREIRRFIGHTNQINSVAFSPDGKYVLTGSGGNAIDFEVNQNIPKDFTVRLWDIFSGNEIKKFEGHTSRVNSVSFSPDGKLILTGSNDKTARLWDLQAGKEIKKIGEHSSSVNSGKFSPNGKFIATGNGDIETLVNVDCKECVAKLFDANSLKMVHKFTGHAVPVGSVEFSPNEKFILTANFTPESDIHLPRGEKKDKYDPFEEETYKSINGVFQWDVETGAKVRDYKGFGPATFSNDSQLVITAGAGSAGEGMQIWDATNGKAKNFIRGYKFQFPEGTIGIGDEYNGVGQIASFSPDNASVLIGFDSLKGTGNFVYEWGEKSLYVVDVNSAERKIALNGNVEKYQNTSLVIGVNPISESNKFLQIGKNIWNKFDSIPLDLEKKDKNVVFQTPQMMSKDGSLFLSGQYTEKSSNKFSIGIWETKSETQISSLPSAYGIWITPDNKNILTESTSDINECQEGQGFILKNFEIRTGKLIWSYCLDISEGGPNGRYLNQDRTYSQLSPNGQFVYVRNPKTDYAYEAERIDELLVIDMFSGNVIKQIQTPKQNIIQGTVISPDGLYIGFSDYNYENRVFIFDVKAGKLLQQINVKNASPIAFSPDSKLLAIQINDGDRNNSNLQLWNVSTGKIVREFPKIDGVIQVQFTSDVSKVIFRTLGLFNSNNNEERLFEISTGKEIYKFEHFGEITSSTISTNGQFVITSGTDGNSKYWSLKTGKELIRLTSFQNGDWIVTTPDGRFDTNNLDKVEGMHWIMPGEPLRPLPIEIFMRQYYEPKLLARVLRCNESQNCEREFKPLPALNTLNRTQPDVKIADIKPDSDGTVEVTVEVANAKSEGQKDTFGSPLESGVYDVRLLRDGQLVGYAPKNVSEGLTTWEWIKSWFVEVPKGSNAVELNQDGKAVLKFSKIKLPKTGIDKVEFSAYAFNADQIKSETSRQTYAFKPNTVKGRAYIVSFGVNFTTKPNHNLRFAANDARLSQENLTNRLREQGQYEEVIGIPLISDFTVNAGGQNISAQNATNDQAKSGQTTVTEDTATKAHLKAVLDVLAGRQGDAELLKTIKNADKLRKANPEDLIIISASSHGFADEEGIFYLVPSDASSAKIESDEFRQTAISSDELSLWLRDVDGGEMTLIIDACHSASAVESADFKPAPMNSRGLGQLSYDKGMRILTATQADNVALETNQTRQGLLSYALLQNGLNDFQADFKPQDNSILMSEWLNFGVERVPKLYTETQTGQTKLVRETNDTAEAENQSNREEKTQQPSLFDFSRKRNDATLGKRNGKLPTKVVVSQEVKPISTPTPMVASSPNSINPSNFNGRVIKYQTVIVRAADSTDSAEVGKVYLNDSIKIGQQKGEWFQVTTVSGVQGWMHGNSLEFVKR